MQHDSSLRSLERLCRSQASLTSDDHTRRVLKEMAEEYSEAAAHQEQDEGQDHPKQQDEE
jgi:hypothetical protein